MAEGSRDGSSAGEGGVGTGEGEKQGLSCLKHADNDTRGNGHCLSTESKQRKASYRENIFSFFTYGTISKVMESSCLFSIKGRKAKKLI